MLSRGGIHRVSKITLDAETFKALASEARLRVLKALDERRKTLAEISRGLELNKATVHEHLQLLAAAGLVRKRDDEGRKWIYYELTWTGARILHPEATTTFNVLLALSVAAAGGGVLTLGRAAGWWLAEKASPSNDPAGNDLRNGPESAQSADAPSDGSAPPESQALKAVEDDSAAGAQGESDPSFFDDGGWLAIALIVCVLVFVACAWMLRRKVSPKPLDEASAAAAESLAS